MEDLIVAIKSNDLVAARKMFEAQMAPVVASLIEEEKIKIGRSIMIEGEEPKDDKDEDDAEDKDDGKDEKDEDDSDDEDEDEDE